MPMQTESNPTPESPIANSPAAGSFVLTNPVPQPQEPANVGELLALGREHAGMSIGDVANRLRMSVKQIEALERADYAKLPAGTFLRGFVRNYAKAVGVNIDTALKVLERTYTDGLALQATGVLAPTVAAAPVAFKPGNDALATPKSRAMIAVLLIVSLSAVVWYWWEFVRPHRADGGRPPDAQQTAVIQPSVTAPPTDAAAATEAAPVSPSQVQPDATGAISANAPTRPPAALPTSTATAAPVAIPPARERNASETDTNNRAKRAGDTGVIGFTFSGDSWVEVVDGTGRTVMSRRYKAGEADEVTGRGPFTIVVGNAHTTRMAYNGREFDLAPHTKATVARVTVK